MFAIGNDELKQCPRLGKSILCDICGKRHKVRYGKEKQEDGTWAPTTNIAFYSCGDNSYLVGIKGKDIRRRKV